MYKRDNIPVWRIGCEPGSLADIQQVVRVPDKPGLLLIGPDGAYTIQGLTEEGKDGGLLHRVYPLDLPGAGHVYSLWSNGKKELMAKYMICGETQTCAYGLA